MQGKRITVILNPKLQEKLDFIMEERGEDNMSQAIKFSITNTYEDLKGPAYVRVKKDKPEGPEELPEDRVKRQLDKKKEEAKLKILVHKKAQMDLAEKLYEPLIEELPNGDVKVTWPIFEKVGQRVVRGSIGKMLDDIFPHHIEDQFRNGTRAEIIKLLKKQDK